MKELDFNKVIYEAVKHLQGKFIARNYMPNTWQICYVDEIRFDKETLIRLNSVWDNGEIVKGRIGRLRTICLDNWILFENKEELDKWRVLQKIK